MTGSLASPGAEAENKKVGKSQIVTTQWATAQRFSSTLGYTARLPAVYLAKRCKLKTTKSRVVSITHPTVVKDKFPEKPRHFSSLS